MKQKYSAMLVEQNINLSLYLKKNELKGKNPKGHHIAIFSFISYGVTLGVQHVTHSSVLVYLSFFFVPIHPQYICPVRSKNKLCLLQS